MLKKGIYENIIDHDTQLQIKEVEQLDLVCKTISIDNAESPKVLADHLAKALRQVIYCTDGVVEL